MIDLNLEVRAFEASLIRSAINESYGNTAMAARALSLNRTTLVEKLKRLKLPRPEIIIQPKNLPNRPLVDPANLRLMSQLMGPLKGKPK